MGKLSDLRQVVGDIADHTERAAKGLAAMDDAARSLNSIQTAKQSDSLGNTPGVNGTGTGTALQGGGQQGTLGNTIGVNTPGGGSAQGAGGGAGKSSGSVAGTPHFSGGRCDGVYAEDGVSVIAGYGVFDPLTGHLSEVKGPPPSGEQILWTYNANLNTGGGGEQGSSRPSAGGWGATIRGGGRVGSTSPDFPSGASPGGGSGGNGTLSAGDKAIIGAIEGLRMDLGGKTPLGTLVRTR